MTARFPELPGLSFSTTKTPMFKSKIQKAVTNRELRILEAPVPTWRFKLKFEFLRDNQDQRAGLKIYQELRTLMGFYLSQQGSFSAFQFTDPTDNSVVQQRIGVGDGGTTQFQLVRTMFGFNEPIIAPNIVSGVYLDSGSGPVRQPDDLSVYVVDLGTGVVGFFSPPGVGTVITVDFSYFFLCRFEEDTQDFENFMAGFWTVGEMKLMSVIL